MPQSRKPKSTKKPKKNAKRNPPQGQVLTASTKFSQQPRANGYKYPTSYLEKICAITDPFCQVAKGAKWPDGNGESTMPASIRGHVPITTFTTGSNIVFVTPALEYSFLVGGSASAGTLTTAGTYLPPPGNATVLGYCNTYRIVSAGIIVRNLLPALTAQGYIIVTRIGQVMPVTSTFNVGNTYGTESVAHPIVAGLEIPLIFRPLGTSSKSFQKNGSSTTTSINALFDTISLEIVGAPASVSCLDIEFVYNIEFTLGDTYLALQQFVPVSSPMDTTMTSVAQQASKKIGDLAMTGVKAFGKATLKAISAALMSHPHPAAKTAGYITNYVEVD